MRLEGKINNLFRFLEIKQTGFYTLLFLVPVGFVIFGLYPLYKITLEKGETASTLAEINIGLENKKNLLTNVPATLIDTQVYLSALRAAIPDTPLLQKYVVDVAELAARSGYKQQRASPSDLQESPTVVRFQFSGVLATFPALVSRIEDTERLTEIQSFKLTFRENEATVDMDLGVYFLK